AGRRLRPGGPAAAPAAGRRKGGRLPVGAGGPELTHQLAEGIVVVAEALGHVLLAAAVEEDGAQGLVLALRGGGGLQEEAAAGCTAHSGRPRCEVISGPICGERVAEGRGAVQGPQESKPLARPGKAGGRQPRTCRGRHRGRDSQVLADGPWKKMTSPWADLRPANQAENRHRARPGVRK